MDASVTALETGAARTPPRRRPRDWVVDTLVFLLAVLFGLLAIGGRLEVSPPVEQDWLFWADVAAGAVGCWDCGCGGAGRSGWPWC